MATYERKQILDYTQGDPTIDLYSGFSVLDDKLSLSEWPIYGSARLGVLDLNGKGELYNNGAIPWTQPLEHTNSGYRQYEISNHLGNVLATISDVKTGIDNPVDGTIDFYEPKFLSRQDYYPFGMIMPGRNDAKKEYRFGFNGQEKTDEISGKGNHNTAKYWEYDTRLGRRWNIDPVVKPKESGYSTLGNNPIKYFDPFGDDIVNKHEDQKNNQSKIDDLSLKLGSLKNRREKRYVKNEIKNLQTGLDNYNKTKDLIDDFKKRVGDDEFKRLNDDLKFNEQKIDIIVQIEPYNSPLNEKKNYGHTSVPYIAKEVETVDYKTKKSKTQEVPVRIKENKINVYLFVPTISTIANEFGDADFGVHRAQKAYDQKDIEYDRQATKKYSEDYEYYVIGKGKKPNFDDY
jgi:RHS repeat-associated protein